MRTFVKPSRALTKSERNAIAALESALKEKTDKRAISADRRRPLIGTERIAPNADQRRQAGGSA